MALPRSWYSKFGPGLGILLHLQTTSSEASAFPFLISLKCLMEVPGFCSAEMWEAWRNLGPASISTVAWSPCSSWTRVWSSSPTRSCHCSGASWTAHFQSMAAFVWDSAPSSGSPGLLDVVFNTGLILRFCSWLYEHGSSPSKNNTMPDECQGFTLHLLKHLWMMNATKACRATFLMCIASVHL